MCRPLKIKARFFVCAKPAQMHLASFIALYRWALE